MDLTDIDERDFSDVGSQIIPADTYIACVDEMKDGPSKSSGKRQMTVDFVIAEGPMKGQKIRNWFQLESKVGKSIFKHFLRCISKDDKAPEKFTDAMVPHCIGRMLKIGTALEPNGNYVNARIICMAHESDNETEFAERHEKALLKFDARMEARPAAPKAPTYNDGKDAGDVPF